MVPAPTQVLFDVELPKALAEHAASAAVDLGASFLITVTSVGAWIVDCRQVPPVCKRVDNNVKPLVDVSVTIREADFRMLLNSPVKAYTAMQLATTGKMTVEGSPVVAGRLEKLLGYLGK